jgi:hypothetical protein
MLIVRINRQVNEHEDKEFAHTEIRKFRRRKRTEFLPQRCQLLAIIADFRQSYSMRRIERSKRLVEDSRRRIFEVELSFSGDD